jgi:hypothetical protein
VAYLLMKQAEVHQTSADLAFVVSRFSSKQPKNCLTDVADKWTSMKELNADAARQERVEWPWERQQLGAAVRA